MGTIRILGIDIPDAGPVFLGALALHVPIALVAVVSGAVAMLARKRAGRHPGAGRVYFCALVGTFVTATVMAGIRFAHAWHLFALGVVAVAAASAAYVARRQRPANMPAHVAGMGLSYVAMLTAFYVDNGPQLPLWDRLPVLAYWLLPAAIGVPLIVRALVRLRRSGAALELVSNDGGPTSRRLRVAIRSSRQPR